MANNRTNNSRDVLLVLLFVSCLASGGIFVRMSDLGPINTGLWRIVFSIPILLPFLLYEKSTTSYKPLSGKDFILLAIAGGFLAGDLAIWNISFHYTTVANANLLANFVPLIIIPVCYFIYKEPISRNFFLGAIVILIGVVLLVSGKSTITSVNLLGDSLAFLTSIFYALFLLMVYKLRNRTSAVQIMFYSGLGSIVTLFFICLMTEGIQFPNTWHAFFPILGLTVFSQILGQGGLSYSLGRISASFASILVLTQPVISAIYAFLFFHESLTWMEVLAMFIVLVGIYLVKRK
ncbi:DMT family transporter [Bartonella sp. HY406]|uniref:DMT family transporter n=1 Tax=Bartonella sp. HY406 TaxID=2979331 RepID=UPI0021C8CC90|nr:DMT family transporter [Bartonella sp. HY406]UXN04020.1 DMT family transporter [Bartonella sp. HY406]